MARVVLGLSGGVDSAASAILLKRMGHEVHALWMSVGVGDPQRARQCAELLEIPFSIADMRIPFKEKVIDPFIHAYLSGQTPNPCILCNPAVKFRTLFDYAHAHGCDFVATGHYARIQDGFLYRGRGPHDQSYMLSRLPAEWLGRIHFPLGDFADKEEVRKIAATVLPPQHSAAQASMEICFIPEGQHWQYIEAQGVRPPAGNFIDDAGNILGTHSGIHRYTVGMRRRLGIATGQRMYVRKINPATGEITLSPATEAARQEIFIRDTHWFAPPRFHVEYGARVRHSRRIGSGWLLRQEDGGYRALVDPACGIPAPGQSAVFYEGEKVLGGGVISAIFKETL